jgi:hypothetical protein
VIRSYSETNTSGDRIRLVKIENLSACATVNWNSDSAVLPVVPNYVNL